MNYIDELYHHGILGQRWGVRRYQNLDGSLTPAGKRKVKELQKRSIVSKNKQDKYDVKAERYGYKSDQYLNKLNSNSDKIYLYSNRKLVDGSTKYDKKILSEKVKRSKNTYKFYDYLKKSEKNKSLSSLYKEQFEDYLKKLSALNSIDIENGEKYVEEWLDELYR